MTRIAIIGAGWAGLQSAALYQNKYGCDVVVFDEKTSLGGTWAESGVYSGLTTHAPARTTQFIGYPYPKDLVPDDRVRIPQSTVKEYVNRFAQDVGLMKNVRLNTKILCIDQINDEQVELTIKNKETGEEAIEAFDYVFNTGFGSEPRKPPAYPGIDTFAGELLTSHHVTDAVIEKLKTSGETVAVLGGSKSSVDMLILLHKAGIPAHWVARKVRSGYREATLFCKVLHIESLEYVPKLFDQVVKLLCPNLNA
jgi:cation diffusion facilitator CzcD-associated flavoprotein CzcO